MPIKSSDPSQMDNRGKARQWVRRYANFSGASHTDSQVPQADIPDPGLQLWPSNSYIPKAYIQLLEDAQRTTNSGTGNKEQSSREGEDTTIITPGSSAANHAPGKEGGQDGSRSDDQQKAVATIQKAVATIQKAVATIQKAQASTEEPLAAETGRQTLAPAFSRTRYFTGLLRRHLRRRRATGVAGESSRRFASRMFAPLNSINPFRHYRSFVVNLRNVYGARSFWWKRRLKLVKERNAEMRKRRLQRPLSADSIDFNDMTDEDMDKEEEEIDLEARAEKREKRTLEPAMLHVPTDGDICVYCGGTIPYDRRSSAPYPFLAQCKDCVAAAVPENRPFTIEFYEQHLERLAEAQANIRLNNNGWFPPLPTLDEEEAGDAQLVDQDDLPNELTYYDLAPKVQLFTPSEERRWKVVVESRPFDAKLWQAAFFPQRTVEEIKVKYWSQGRTLVAGGMQWSIEESNLFFQGLRRFGKHNVWAIQEHIKSRSLAEVVTMIQAMEAEVALQEKLGMRLVRLSHMPMAEEVNDDDIRLEERCADILVEKELKARRKDIDRKKANRFQRRIDVHKGDHDSAPDDALQEKVDKRRVRVSDMAKSYKAKDDDTQLEGQHTDSSAKKLKARRKETDRTTTNRLQRRNSVQKDDSDAYELRSAEMVGKTLLFNMKTLANLTSRVYAQNERACIERDVVLLMYEALKDFLRPLIKELVALSHERRRTAALRAPGKEVRTRYAIQHREITENDVFRLLLSHQLPMGTHQFFDDLPKRLNYYVFPEQVYDPVLTPSGRPRVYDLNRDVDVARGKAPDSDVDYDSDDEVADVADHQWPARVVALPPMTPQKVHCETKGQSFKEMIGVIDTTDYVPNGIRKKPKASPPVFTENAAANQDYMQHFHVKRKRDEAWRQTEFAQKHMRQSSLAWQRMEEEAESEGDAWRKRQKWEEDVIHPRLRPFEPMRSSSYSTVHPTSVADFGQWRDRVDRMIANMATVGLDDNTPEAFVHRGDNVYTEVESVNKRFRSHAQIIDSRETRVYTYRPKYHRERRLIRHVARMEKLARVGHRDLNRLYRPGYGLLPESASFLADPTRSAVPSSTTPVKPGAGFGMGFQEQTGLWMRQTTDLPTGDELSTDEEEDDEEELIQRRWINGKRVSREPSPELFAPPEDRGGLGVEGSDDAETEDDAENDAGRDEKDAVLAHASQLLKEDNEYFEVEDEKDEEREERLCRGQILADDLVLIRESVGQRRRELEAEATHRYLTTRFRYFRSLRQRREWHRQYLARRDAWIRKYWNKSDGQVQRMEARLEQTRGRRQGREQLEQARRRDLEQRELATRRFVRQSFIWRLWKRRHQKQEPKLDPRYHLQYETMADATNFVEKRLPKELGKTDWFPCKPGQIAPGVPRKRGPPKAARSKAEQSPHDSSDSDEFDAELLRPGYGEKVLHHGQWNSSLK